MDDGKLVDALTGDLLVYRRRGIAPRESGLPQSLPKRVAIVVDCSGSMYRFNGSDQRLERLMEAVLLIMQAFAGYQHRVDYCIVGHSGDGMKSLFCWLCLFVVLFVCYIA